MSPFLDKIQQFNLEITVTELWIYSFCKQLWIAGNKNIDLPLQALWHGGNNGSPFGRHSGSKIGHTNCRALALQPDSTIISKYGRASSRSANLLTPGRSGNVVRS